MTVAIQVKILTAVCGRCGTDVIGDNMGTGRAWQHLNGVDDRIRRFALLEMTMDVLDDHDRVVDQNADRQ